MMNAITFEEALRFTGPIYLVEIHPVVGGSTNKESPYGPYTWYDYARRRFLDSSHGPRGRKPRRLKGQETIRRYS